MYTENWSSFFVKACSTQFDANYTLTPCFCKMVFNNITLLLDLPNSLILLVCLLNVAYACASRAFGAEMVSQTTDSPKALVFQNAPFLTTMFF